MIDAVSSRTLVCIALLIPSTQHSLQHVIIVGTQQFSCINSLSNNKHQADTSFPSISPICFRLSLVWQITCDLNCVQVPPESLLCSPESTRAQEEQLSNYIKCKRGLEISPLLKQIELIFQFLIPSSRLITSVFQFLLAPGDANS